jgi:hypothetical protein
MRIASDFLFTSLEIAYEAEKSGFSLKYCTGVWMVVWYRRPRPGNGFAKD